VGERLSGMRHERIRAGQDRLNEAVLKRARDVVKEE
jgi:hypothetical protein